MPVEESFCRYVLEDGAAVVLEDTRSSERTRDNPSVAQRDVAAWAGFPVRGPGGEVLGSLCVYETEPRAWSDQDLTVLEGLATVASTEVQLRMGLADAAERQQALRRLIMQTPAVTCILRGPQLVVELANRLAVEAAGVGTDVEGRPLRELLTGADEDGLVQMLEGVYRTGEPIVRQEQPVLLARGRTGGPERHYYNYVAQPIRRPDGQVEAVLVFAHQVSDQVLARRSAEAVAGRLARLQRVTAALSGALTPEDVGQIAVEECRELLGADGAMLCLVDETGDELRLSNAAGIGPRQRAELERVPLESPLALTECVRTGEPAWLECRPDWERVCPNGAALFAGEAEATAMLPLAGLAGSAAGVLALTFAEERETREGERSLAVTMSGQCAQALQRARLYQREEEAHRRANAERDRAAFLAEVSLALDRPVGLEERLATLGRLVVPALADVCTVRLGDGHSSRLVAAVHADPEMDPLLWRTYGRYCGPPDRSGPARVIASGRPELVPEIDPVIQDSYAPDRAFLADLHRLDLGSYLCVPLTARGRTLGSLALQTVKGGRRLGREELALAQEVGRRAGLAVDNAALFEAQQDVALALQRNLLPAQLPEIDGVELAARYQAATAGTEAGGDFYDAFPLPDGRLGLAVGDVVGRGPEAAAVMGQLRSVLRALAIGGAEPDEVLASVSRFANGIRGAVGATALYAVLEPERGTLHYACAGHPPPLVIGRSYSARYLWDGRGPLLGVGTSYRAGSAELEPADAVVLYTDGLYERRGTSVDRDLEALVAAAAGPPHRGGEALCDRLLDRMAAGAELEDDLALLVARRWEEPAIGPLEVSFPADPGELAALRARVREWLEPLELGSEQVMDILLALTEAGANAVEHAYDGRRHEGRVEASARHENGSVLLEVRDHGSWRSEPSSAERGRGILLMRETMDSLEVATGTDGGTVVTMRMLVRDPPVGRETAASVVPEGQGGVVLEGEQAGPLQVARLRGEVDRQSTDRLGPALRAALADGPRGLAVDLTGVTFLDSSGLRLLVELEREARAREMAFALVAPPQSPPRRVLDLARVSDDLYVVESLDQARLVPS